jgi:hypothetical protein
MTSTIAKVKAVRTADRLLSVWLSDGRILSLPLAWYPLLAKAKPAARELWQASGAGRGIHWPALDYDLSVQGLLEVRHEHESAGRYADNSATKTNRTRKLPLRRSSSSSTKPKGIRKPSQGGQQRSFMRG